MGIKRFGDYDKTQAYGDFQPLPKGGYVVRILGATVHENSNGQYVFKFIKDDKHFSKYYEAIYILFNTRLHISEFCGLTIHGIDFKEM